MEVLLLIFIAVSCGASAFAVHMAREVNKDLLDLASFYGKLSSRVQSLENAPHGLKLDGTPKKKPGRKPAKSFTVNVK